MTPLVFMSLAIAGGVGAAARLALDGVIHSRTRGAMPWGTITINISGSFVLGLVAGLTTAQIVPEDWHLIIGAGLRGVYTTFSTASFETVRLIQSGNWVAGALNGLGTLVCATLAAGLGLWIGGLM